MVQPIVLLHLEGEMKRKLEEYNNDTEISRVRDLAAIKLWLRQQPHLPDEWEDKCLLRFLRVCRFSLEKTKKKLDFYFTMRTACPEFFLDRDITRPDLATVVKQGFSFTAPFLTAEGRRVTFIKVVEKNANPRDLALAFKISTMIGDIRLMEEEAGAFGEVGVVDASIMSPSILSQVPFTAVRKFCRLPEAYPVKLKEIHVINITPISEIVINIVKSFIKEKIRNRIFLHKDISGLYQYLPKEHIPSDFGGTDVSLEERRESWIKKLELYTEWFKAQESVKADESLRPGKPIDYDDLFGVDGSFRELTID